MDLTPYVAMLQGFRSGDWGRIKLEAGESSRVVKRRLTLAAKERRIKLRHRAHISDADQILFRVL